MGARELVGGWEVDVADIAKRVLAMEPRLRAPAIVMAVEEVGKLLEDKLIDLVSALVNE